MSTTRLTILFIGVSSEIAKTSQMHPNWKC